MINSIIRMVPSAKPRATKNRRPIEGRRMCCVVHVLPGWRADALTPALHAGCGVPRTRAKLSNAFGVIVLGLRATILNLFGVIVLGPALSRWDPALLMQTSINLQEWFGGIDIYLFDQLLKGRFVSGMRVLDAGCGSGRNLRYFLRSGFEVFGVDESEEAIAQTRQLAATLAPHLPADNFRVEPVERMSFGEEANSKDPPTNPGGSDNAGFDVVLSSAVLHFARDEQLWQAMVNEMWRVLKPGGILFARLASTIGMEHQVRLIEGRRYHLPDGSDRFLVDEPLLQRVTSALGGDFIEPIKTTVVENMRAMTTWVVRKR